MAEGIDKIMYSFVMDDVLKGFFIRVPPGYVACVYDLGRGVLKKIYKPGLHLKIPFWQKAMLFNTQTLEYNINKKFNPDKPEVLGDQPITATTNDGKKIAIEGTILMRLDAEQIPEIWQSIGEKFVEKIIRPTIQSRLRMIAAKYDQQEIATTKRAEVEIDARKELERILYPRGIFVENVLLSEINLAH
ncbi:MAG: prohibitin family protein [Patescibacteria group bacterium]|jgi:regulator of protease activity HflC (stomatin/prohibitin superfamily)|nr:prohibitin family protein [Patescibacteria group bacterium]